MTILSTCLLLLLQKRIFYLKLLIFYAIAFNTNNKTLESSRSISIYKKSVNLLIVDLQINGFYSAVNV